MRHLIFDFSRWGSTLAVISLVLLQTACLNLDEPGSDRKTAGKPTAVLEPVEEPFCVVSIHQTGHLDAKPEDLVKLNHYFGGTITLYRIPLLHSANIYKIEKAERPGEPGYFNLRLHLTPEGKEQWLALSGKFDGKNLAFVVDGIFYRFFKPRRFYSDTANTIMLDGPFDSVNAEKIQHYSEFNYRELQKN